MTTACSNTYFVGLAAVHTKSKQKNYVIWNAAVVKMMNEELVPKREATPAFMWDN